jgi:hypothetical protein
VEFLNAIFTGEPPLGSDPALSFSATVSAFDPTDAANDRFVISSVESSEGVTDAHVGTPPTTVSANPLVPRGKRTLSVPLW